MCLKRRVAVKTIYCLGVLFTNMLDIGNKTEDNLVNDIHKTVCSLFWKLKTTVCQKCLWYSKDKI